MIKRRAEQHSDEPRSPGAPGPGGRSIAAGGDISGIASSGDDAVNVQYRAEQMTVLPEQAFRPWAELAAPAGLSNMPRLGLFVGRADELARLGRGHGRAWLKGGESGSRRRRQEHPGRAVGRRARRRVHRDLVDHRRHPG